MGRRLRAGYVICSESKITGELIGRRADKAKRYFVRSDEWTRASASIKWRGTNSDLCAEEIATFLIEGLITRASRAAYRRVRHARLSLTSFLSRTYDRKTLINQMLY